MINMQYADLEIGIHRRSAALAVGRVEPDADQPPSDDSSDSFPYTVELRYSSPVSEVGKDYDPGVALISKIELLALASDPARYGKLLWQCAFTSSGAEAALNEARAATEQSSPPFGLRVRLLIGRSAPELHELHWECLWDPRTDAPLGTDENFLLSRYLGTQDWRPVRLRPRRELKALVVIASPSDLAQRRLSPIDVEGEWQRASESLQSIALTRLPALPTAGEPALRATLAAIATCLRTQAPDIVYLVCHGQRLSKGNARLWLEKDDGTADEVPGVELARCILSLQHRPSLVVLASCESAGSGKYPGLSELSALGPLLAEAGVPAVLAMQGKITQNTVKSFMPEFFTELRRDGQIDRALAAARAKVIRDRADWWMPVLYTRLKRGLIWYEAGFSGQNKEFEGWKALTLQLKAPANPLTRTTALIGPGLDDGWVGADADIADDWARDFQYPFAASDTNNLPRIAQFIAGGGDRPNLTLVNALFQTMGKFLAAQHGAVIDQPLPEPDMWTGDSLIAALKAAAKYRWHNDPSPEHLAYRNLARLRLPIYITLSHSPLLALALEEEGVKPQVRLCPWWITSPLSKALAAKCLLEDAATQQEPLVYHLFGHLDTPDSMVITEDDHFDFLLGLIRAKDAGLLPSELGDALRASSLFFVGFDPEKWAFRVLFRAIMSQLEGRPLRNLPHVTAQVEPDEGRNIDIRRARASLEKALLVNRISMYWGNSEQFLSDLMQRLVATKAGKAP